MAATAFNPLEAAQDLEAAGFERRQAEAIARVVNQSDERAATKADLDAFAATFRSEFRAVNSRVDALHSRIGALQWGVGIQSAVTLATFAIVAAKLL